MDRPVILINAKAYREASGKELLSFLKKLASSKGLSKARVIIALQPMDLLRAKDAGFLLYGQHVDGVGFGSHTGHVHAQILHEAGAMGTLLNHAERQLTTENIKGALTAAHNAKLETCVCANTPERGAELAQYSPSYIAVEPPDLIGGDVSVSKARPEIITDSLSKIRKKSPEQKVLVGAGIKNGEDLRIALRLGAQGVLLASGIVKHPDPASVLADLLSVL